MDMEILDEIIFASDESKCEKFFETMSERERRSFAPRAMSLLKEANQLRWDIRLRMDLYLQLTSPPKTRFEGESGGKITPLSQPAAIVAVNATCTLAELKSFGINGLPEPEQAVRIMSARKPSFLEAWCKFVLRIAAQSHWLTVYLLEQTGTQVEHTSQYWFGMYEELLVRPSAARKLLSSDREIESSILQMLADQKVVTALSQPDMVEHEGRKDKRFQPAFSIPEKGTARYSTLFWHEFLLDLVQENKLDRQKLIRATFNMLFILGEQPERRAKYQQISTAAFAIDLTRILTEEALIDNVDNFINLIGAEHNDVAVFALESLQKISVASFRFPDISRLLARSFTYKQRLRTESAFSLLNRLIGLSPEGAMVFVPAMLAALVSFSKDTQIRTISLFAQTGVLNDANVRQEFTSRTQSLTGLEKARAMELLNSQQPLADPSAIIEISPSSGQPSQPDRAAGNERFRDVLERIANLPAALLTIARVDEALHAFETNQIIDAPVFLNSTNFPQLSGRSQLVSQLDFDSLIYMLMKVATGQATAMDFEFSLNGISRMPTLNQELRMKTAPLWEKTKSMPDGDIFYGYSWAFHRLMVAWINRKDIDKKGYFYESCSLLSHRFHSVQRRVIKNQPSELLAFPTHDGGWIDPQILVQRVKQFSQKNIAIDQIELVQALLRIANENRDIALDDAHNLNGENGAVIRYALGGSPGEVETPALWTAAFRAREPWGSSDLLHAVLPECGPDGVSAAVYRFVDTGIAEYMTDRYATLKIHLPNFIQVHSDDPSFPDAQKASSLDDRSLVSIQQRQKRLEKYFLFPTVLLHDSTRIEFTPCEETLWLHNRESLFSLYAKRLMRNLNSVADYWQGQLELLFDSNVSLSGNGRYVICLAMSSKSDELSRFAVDALISAIADCRISDMAYSEAMVELIATDILTLRRFVRGFRDVAKVSAMHALFVWRVVSWLLSNPLLPEKDLLIFLELLVEIQIDYAFKPDEILRTFLINLTGSNKRTAAASVILGHAETNDMSMRLAALESLESRVRRVINWQASGVNKLS